ncbi:hypothetical protein BDA99DRAFT_330578 [Phascolomyces articulosus]|uniref:Uncharacterized protein n=1 Tax=Phascolomyces articulosus TaxID=60185 RepID=A0AAD5JL97_9FUNG|nr:hypothetical protein BDA99DRAFT_330578 [Phascolomyces articulosus]
MMKYTILSIISLIACATFTSADISVVTPNANTTWTTGGNVDITWTVNGTDANNDCYMDLIQVMGPSVYRSVTSIIPGSGSVKCTDKSYKVENLHDFPSGNYLIIMGSKHGNDLGAAAYESEVFKFEGNGTATPRTTDFIDGAASSTISSVAAKETNEDSESASVSLYEYLRGGNNFAVMGVSLFTVASLAFSIL